MDKHPLLLQCFSLPPEATRMGSVQAGLSRLLKFAEPEKPTEHRVAPKGAYAPIIVSNTHDRNPYLHKNQIPGTEGLLDGK